MQTRKLETRDLEPIIPVWCSTSENESVEGRPLDDTELVERARAGDVAAYGELMQRYQGIAFRTAWVLTGETSEAEDAAQSAFIKAYDALPRFKPGAPFRPWLLTIVANEARNRTRAAGRRRRLELRLAEGRLVGDPARSPEEAALSRECRDALMRALNRLAEADRAVIVARYFLDLSEIETASVLGCRRGTVKSRLSRALGRLRMILSQPTADLEVLERPHGE